MSTSVAEAVVAKPNAGVFERRNATRLNLGYATIKHDSELQVESKRFSEILVAKHNHDLRVFNRDLYSIGEVIKLREFDREHDKYSGPTMLVKVINMTPPSANIHDKSGTMTFRRMTP